MASAVFEGTSLVNMFVRGCWVNGIRRLIVSRRGDEEEFFEIRTEWSDRSVLYLHRSFADLGRLCKRLRDAFPEDRPELARAPLRQEMCTNFPVDHLKLLEYFDPLFSSTHCRSVTSELARLPLLPQILFQSGQ